MVKIYCLINQCDANVQYYTLIGQDRDQINMILGEVLSNKCFIIPAHVVCTQSITSFIDPDQEAIHQVAPLYKFAYCIIYFGT